jgi:hypothetical protein
MLEFLRHLFDYTDFNPRNTCGAGWNSALVWLHIISDFLIWFAYVAIPCVLIYFVRKRRDIPYRHVFWLFGLFILSCGTTHLVGMAMFSYPMYRLDGLIKLITAVVSLATVAALIPITPRFLAMRSPQELEAEIAQRKEMESKLQTLNVSLEEKVKERTAALEMRAGELSAANEQLRHAAAEQKRLEERFRLAVEASPNAMIMVDRNGRIVLTNDQTHKMFDYRRDELIGHDVEMLIPERFRSQHPEHRVGFFTSPIARPMGVGRDLYGRRKNGEEFPVEIGLNPIETQAGMMVLSSIIDITARKQAEEERGKLLEREQTARADAERANQLKDQFLAVCSHELRTPLTPILGWTRMLRNGPLDDKTLAHAIDVIERNARVETQLIDDLLDVSRILSGKMKLQVSQTDVISVVHDAIESVRPAAEAKNIRIEIAESAGSTVLADSGRLQQIIWNLLSNAVKFSLKGGVVSILLSEDESHARIVIADHGEGIDPAFLPHIFDRFRQADSSTTRSHGGLGLGLSIVKHLVEMHHGSIEVESAGKGKGATFTVLLPRLQNRRQTKTIERPVLEPLERSLTGQRILVVDDEPDTCDFLSAALRRSGAVVTTASNVRDALREIQHELPSVLISDIGMPDDDGYVLIRKVRERNSAATLPAIALTAYAKQEDRIQALASGFQEHVAKPVDPEKLERIIYEVVERTSEKNS